MGECRERGVPVLAPDIDASHWHFSVEPGKGVRFGLGALKGLGETAVESIVTARTELGGRIVSLHQLCEILDLRIANKRVFEALVKSGACDGLTGRSEGEPIRAWRARLAASIDAACEHGNRTQRDRDLGQADLFGGGDAATRQAGPQLPLVPAWTEIEQLNFEKESLGLYWSGHPVDRYAADLAAYGARGTHELVPKPDAEALASAVEGAAAAPTPPERAAASNGGETVVGGIVSGLRPLKTRKGDRMCVFMLDDARGSVEVVVFPETFKQWGHVAESGKMVVVTGKLERDDESARILATEVAPIEVLTERLATSVAITVTSPPHDRSTVERRWDVLSHHKGDRAVALTIETRPPLRPLRVRMDVHNQFRVRPSDSLVADIERVCGQGAVTLAKTPRVRL
jgi:DNA polymerase-3 subunit alpha